MKTKSNCQSCYAKYNRASNPTYLDNQKKRRNTTEGRIKSNIYRKEYKIRNPEKVRLAKNLYRINNPDSRKGESQLRDRLIKLQQIKLFFSKELKQIYKNCPEELQVDHIVPIIHPNICGLHVPWNMQYLTPFDNNSKNNHWDGTFENKNWKNK